MAIEGTPSVTPLARAVDLGAVWNADDEAVASRLHPAYRDALGRLPDGPAIFRGLPFALGSRAEGRRWLLLDGERSIDLRASGPATHVVVAHFSDSWRDAAGERPAGRPVGWVLPTGEPLARYVLRTASGAVHEIPVRRRVEVADGIIGWGFLPFAAIGHRSDAALDWRGPHATLAPGRYARAGHAGPLTILAGSWGAAQTGVADFVPTPDDDITYWLHVIALERRDEPVELVVAPVGGGRPGTDVVIAGLTLFDGRADPLVVTPRRQLLVSGAGLPMVDLGVAIAAQPISRPSATKRPGPVGWGRRAAAPDSAPSVVDVAVAPDARLTFDGWSIPVAELDSEAASPDGRVRVVPLPPANVRTTVRLTADGEAAPARVRFVAADGRLLPPLGHREEINPGILEDTGAGLVLGGETWAYVPGEFAIDLPPGTVEIEVVKGFDHRPVRRSLTVDGSVREVAIDLERAIDLRGDGWRSSDSHVHFLSPSTALLQAAAEDVTWVHVLATQLGDAFPSVTDLAWGGQRDPSGRHEVLVGTENRQNLLGHLALLGARRPTLPLASGGAPEGRIGAPTVELLADWAEACRAAGGLVVGAHFPLPFAEIAADIVEGAIDAVELQVFAPGLDSPSITEWYRFLNCGYRLPLLGGTDKMSAEIPVGQIRTYARLDPDIEPGFDAWAAAVRAGRTFATSGPVIELEVDGREPGDVIALPPTGGRLEVSARARAAQPVIGAVEIVVNGQVVAAETNAEPTTELAVQATVAAAGSAWIAARSRSPHEIHSAFATSMAAHTSPVYVEVADRPLFVREDADAILEVIDGTARWLATMATVADPAARARLVERVAASAERLRGRGSRP